MGFYAFGTRLQSLWIMLFARKDILCEMKNPIHDKILFRQLRFSLFSSACYFDICLCRFLSKYFSTFSTFSYTFQRLNNKVADNTVRLRRLVCVVVAEIQLP